MPFTPRPPSSGSGGGGNATVPDDAPIQPPQAFVDCDMASVLAAADGNGILDWSNKELTSLDAELMGLILSVFGGLGTDPAINLSGSNHLSMQAVNDILGAAALKGPAGGTLDLSGGTNADVTGFVDRIPLIIRVDFPDATPAPDLAGAILLDTASYPIFVFLGDATLSDSLGNLGGNDALFRIGISDAPTRAQIIAKLVELGGSAVVDNGDGSVNITIDRDTAPYSLNANTTGLVITEIQAGVNRALPDSIAALVAAGWTVIVNIGGVPTTFAP